MFFWNSRQAKGNSLDFVRLFYGWSFEQAIEELTGYEGKTIMKPEPPQEEEPKDLHISQAPDNKRVIAYLCQTRNQDLRKNHLERWIFELLDQITSRSPYFN